MRGHAVRMNNSAFRSFITLGTPFRAFKPESLFKRTGRERTALLEKTQVRPALCSDNDWALWTAVVGCAAIGQVGANSRIGKTLSSPLVIMLLGFLSSLTRIIPVECRTYDLVYHWCVPLAAVMYLLETDVYSDKSESVEKWIVPVFCIGAIGTVIGTLVAWGILGGRLGEDGWKLATVLCATYIGGSINFAATAASVGFTSGPLLGAALAVDNIMMFLYLSVISAIPVGRPDAKRLPSEAMSRQSAVIDLVGLDPDGQSRQNEAQTGFPLLGLCIGLLCCAVGKAVAISFNLHSFSIAFMTLVASSVGLLLDLPDNKRNALRGSRATGSALMSISFVIIGASCGSVASVLRSTPGLFLFASIQIAVHLLFVLFFSHVFSIPLPYILTASNACIGGPATAAGMAAAKGWESMVQPAIILGCMGYASANLISVLVSYIIKIFL